MEHVGVAFAAGGIFGVIFGQLWHLNMERLRAIKEMRANCHHDFEELEAMGYTYLQCRRCKHQEPKRDTKA